MGSSAVGVTPSPCILWQMVGGCCCCPSLVEYPGPKEVCRACRVLLPPSPLLAHCTLWSRSGTPPLRLRSGWRHPG